MCRLKMAIIGYARVSTRGQNLTGQIDALKAAGAGTIFREKVSGARADRPQLAKLMAGLKAGDVVIVTKLDRLGRSTRELLDLIDRIGKAGASFRSLGTRSGTRHRPDYSRRSWPPSLSSSGS
jgi:DNA invertase Pin-like site-specific DNA recombinase